MTQRVAALFDSLEQCAQQERAEITRLRERLQALEAENQRLRLASAQPVESLSPSVVPSVRHTVERGYPLPRRETTAVKPETSQSPASGSVPTVESTRQTAASETPESTEPQSRLPIGEAPSPQALLDEWYRRYTDTFFKGHTRPLKVGIHEDLAANEPWPDKLVRRALACYVNLPRYLKAVRVGAERVDLGGEPAGIVTQGEARHAHKKLESLQAQQRQRDKTAHGDARQNTRLDRKLGDLLAKHSRH